MELTKSELEIMDVLWDSGSPLSRSDLLERAEEKTWKDSSVHILLNGLLQKGAIAEAGLVKRSKTYGRVFAPTMSREAYYAQNILSRRRRPDMSGLIAQLLEQQSLSEEQMRQISEEVRREISK